MSDKKSTRLPSISRTCVHITVVSSISRLTSSESMSCRVFRRWLTVTWSSSSADEHDSSWYLKPMRMRS